MPQEVSPTNVVPVVTRPVPKSTFAMPLAPKVASGLPVVSKRTAATSPVH